MKSTYKAILFDLFGTLLSVSKAAKGQGQYTADILGLDRKAWNQACFGKHHDIVTRTDHLETVRRIAHSLDSSIPLHKVRQAADARQLRFNTALLEIEPGILTILQYLKQQGFILGLISNASTGEVDAWPDSPLAPLFTSVHFSWQRGVQKPDPAIYRMALDELAIAPRAALFIGDGSSEEHMGAETCGIDSLLVTYFLDGCNEQELKRRGEGSKGRIKHIRELLKRVSPEG
ncbi:MAG: HAD family hydrolase [Candidatus Thiodiazotropha lotti]|nr:HAD family hydrolase [Candidatus Thiodiazotropha lotti]MCG7920686.1 HAD family hydrolase [Candidatus Thiodiazotropha lotti]MCG7929836.1 HAD family hydrolase [Candidatus Thiodiazotropha lotti]MCG7989544.1 HAD family hydrolase [Candidatus Thiodiazotropha lotti]MCG8002662.1 HAD family hydrolase [Candidatus Thiodiazotropha lotti]